MTDDPWAHRSERMRCRTCMWFVEKARPMAANEPMGTHQVVCCACKVTLTVPCEPTGVPLPAPPAQIGRCRRHAPTMSGYPVVFPSDWCGDHKLDEAKA